MLAAFLIGLAAGIAATPHCLGMCGGFPLHLARTSGAGAKSGRAICSQLLFVGGKTFTYVFLGTVASSLGVIVLKDTSLARFAPFLRVLAGAVTLMFGLLMLGFRLPPIKGSQRIIDTGLVRSLFGSLLSNPTPAASLCLGLGVGFLPCPLPMGMLAVAAASHNIAHAMLLMAGVGLGTAPGLLGVGLFGIGLDKKFAKNGIRLAGVVVVAVGLLTIGRATGMLTRQHTATHVVPSCCEGHSE